MVTRGYEVFFLTGSDSKSRVEEIGATFRSLQGIADFTAATMGSLFTAKPPPGPYRLGFAMKYIFASTIPAQFESVQSVLRELKEKYAGRKIVIIQEYMFWGTLPLMAGAAGLRPDAFISLGIAPLPISGPAIPPFGLGLPFDLSASGMTRNEQMYKQRDELFGELTTALSDIFLEYGIKPLPDSVFDYEVTLPDRFLQMCIPDLEYPNPTPPSNLRFVGGLPQGHKDATKEKPSWWDDVAVNASRKRIVAVSQGTATAMYEKLIIPTLEALADSEFLIVVALGRPGAVLPESVVVPHNARVIDYIPFDELLPYADVFLTNGGYGGLQHAVSHGIPLVVAGIEADKPEVAARVEWAGLGINMRTEKPSPEAVREAVERVLGDGKFMMRAKQLEKESEKYNIFDIVARNIEEVLAEKS